MVQISFDVHYFLLRLCYCTRYAIAEKCIFNDLQPRKKHRTVQLCESASIIGTPIEERPNPRSFRRMNLM
jgi:hypothetical protein